MFQSSFEAVALSCVTWCCATHTGDVVCENCYTHSYMNWLIEVHYELLLLSQRAMS